MRNHKILILFVFLALGALFVACDSKKGADSPASATPKTDKAEARKAAPGAKKGEVVVSLSESDKAYLIGVARKAFEVWTLEKKVYEPTDVPEHLKTKKVNRVFATIYKQGEWRGCVSADKKDIIPTVVHSVINTAKDSRFEDPRPDELVNFRVELSFLQPFEVVDTKDPKEIEKQIEPGVHGISIEHVNGRRAYFLPYVFVKRQRTTVAWLERICQKAKLPKDAWQTPEATIYRYDTLNFIEETPNGRHVDLYRYKVELDSVPANALPVAIDLAAKWFIRHQDNATARFAPGHDTEIKPIRRDHAVLQLLAMAALGYSETTRTFGSSMDRVYTWFMGGFKEHLNRADGALVVNAPDAKALEATLAFAEFVTNSAKLPERAALAKAVAQHLRGALDPASAPTENGDIVRDIRTYALLVMARLAVVTGEAADGAKARALYDAWYEGGKPLSLAAVAAMVALDSKDETLYKALLAELDGVVRRQFTAKTARFTDYIGAFEGETVPTAAGVAMGLRGLALAYPQIKTEDGRYATDVVTAAMFASRWLLEQQFTEVSAFYIPNYGEILGSFKSNVVLNTSRLDDTAWPMLALIETQAAMGDALAAAFTGRAAELNK